MSFHYRCAPYKAFASYMHLVEYRGAYSDETLLSHGHSARHETMCSNEAMLGYYALIAYMSSFFD